MRTEGYTPIAVSRGTKYISIFVGIFFTFVFSERARLREFREQRMKKKKNDDVTGFSRPTVDDGATRDTDDVMFMYLFGEDTHDEH